jgi:hypothetical protein
VGQVVGEGVDGRRPQEHKRVHGRLEERLHDAQQRDLLVWGGQGGRGAGAGV